MSHPDFLSPGKKERLFFGFFRLRNAWMPTWRALLAFLLIASATGTYCVRSVHPFLAVSMPVAGAEVLVVEGWANDVTLAEALKEFRLGHYKKLCVTGGPIDKGDFLFKYHTYAEVGQLTLIAMGFEPTLIYAVPAPPILRDRTYASAVALKQWLEAHDPAVNRINVMSEGTHSRRTHLMFKKAFGPVAGIGVIAVQDSTYDPRRWWVSSQGFRTVINELLAYFYARVFF